MIADEADAILFDRMAHLKCPYFCGLTATNSSDYDRIENAYLSALGIETYIDSGIKSTVESATAVSRYSDLS